MALFDRTQKHRSSFGSTATIVVFLAVCLLGMWMMSRPGPVPAPLEEKVKADVKEEDSSIDATNTVKQGSANIVVDTTTPKQGDDGKAAAAAAKNQSFDDENGTTEGGDLVKPGVGEADGATARGKSAEEAALEAGDVKEPQEQTPTDTSTEITEGGLDKNADQMPTDSKETAATTIDVQKNQTFDDENGKMDGVDLVKEGGNKTLVFAVMPRFKTAATAAGSKEEAVMAATDTATTTFDEEKTQDSGEQQLPEAEALPNVIQAELLAERAAQNGSFTTQAAESTQEKKLNDNKKGGDKKGKKKNKKAEAAGAAGGGAFAWKLCNSSAGADYIPCLDNEAAIRKLKSTRHYEHRERHCPAEAPTCLVPAPAGYREPIRWPHSRNKIWYHNVPHTRLAEYKGHQNWVKVSGEHITFPGGGTQFKHGALHYIDVIQEALPEVAWGRRSRVVLDVGCGVASFGGYLFDRDALTMSLAPKDEHEA